MWVIMTSVDFIGGDDGGDALGAGWLSNLQDNLGQEATDFDLDDGSDELISSAHVAEAFARGGTGRLGGRWQVVFEGGLRDAVMTAGSLDGAQLAGKDPLLDGGVADADGGGSLAWSEQGVKRFHRCLRCKSYKNVITYRIKFIHAETMFL
jgi:hypothetical protein